MDRRTSILSALLDPNRLQLAGALVDAPATSAELATRTGLDPATVLAGLADLRAHGVVEADGETYVLPSGTLRGLAREFADDPLPMDPAIGFGMTDDERAVLVRYFEGRSLTEVPSSRAKRLVVLERLALEFDVGRRYSEPEINDILRTFSPDVAALRRHLIDEGLLDRGEGAYWRSGGRVDL